MILLQSLKGASFLKIYLIVSLLTTLWYHLIAGLAYYVLYVKKNCTELKTQVKYPTAKTVFHEAREGTICIWAATINVALTIYLSLNGMNYLITDWYAATPLYHLLSIIMLIIILEIFEWFFHWYSHKNAFLWKIHKKHHVYPNPTPYAVLSDHPLDMWVKSSPLLWVPLIMPIWGVALIGWFAFVNFFYGVYLHSGFEFVGLPNRHSKFLVSSWHHNTHHSSNLTKNFGFFTGFMDIIFGTRFTPEDHAKRINRLKKHTEPATEKMLS